MVLVFEPQMLFDNQNMEGLTSKTMRLPFKTSNTSTKELHDCVKNIHLRMSSLRTNFNLHDCKQIHNLIIKAGLEQNVYLGSKLVSIYGSSGSVENARQVFDKMPLRNVVLWTAIINGYVRNGLNKEARSLYFEMESQGTAPNDFTLSSVLKACAGLVDAEEGMDIHVDIMKRGFVSYVNVGSALVDMYAKCGRIEDARQVFDKMPDRDVVLWNAIIWGFVQNRKAKEAMEYFCRMIGDGIKPNANVMVSVLKACSYLGGLHWGKEIHAQIVKNDLDYNAFVGSALVTMYAQCKRVEFACKVFNGIFQRNVILWNAMINAYCQNGCSNEALKVFCQMQQNRVKPDQVTFAEILPACASLRDLKWGKEIHGYVIRYNVEFDVFVSSALIDMYSKCGRVDVARRVFDMKSERDVISWTAMIAGYGMNGHHMEAMKCFHQMQDAGFIPNGVTYVALLSTL